MHKRRIGPRGPGPNDVGDDTCKGTEEEGSNHGGESGETKEIVLKKRTRVQGYVLVMMLPPILVRTAGYEQCCV